MDALPMSNLSKDEVSLLDDEPPVLGAGAGPAPMPTEFEAWQVWRRAYVARWVEKGFDENWGESWFDAEPDAYELSDDPAAAADDDMMALEDDGDGPID